MTGVDWLLFGVAGYVILIGAVVLALRVDAWLVKRTRQQPQVRLYLDGNAFGDSVRAWNKGGSR